MLPHRVKAGALGSGCQLSLGAEDAEPEAGSPPQGPTEEGSTSRLVVLEGITLFRASLDNVSFLSGPRGISQDLLQGGGTSPGLSRRPCPSLCAGSFLHMAGRGFCPPEGQGQAEDREGSQEMRSQMRSF